MTLFYFLDIIGIIAFAISGSLMAMRKKMDPFGVFIIAFATAVGGGTLRDVLIGAQPVFWMKNTDVIYFIVASYFIAIIFRKKLKYLNKSLFLFDSIGLGLYTIMGTEIGLNANFHPIIIISIATMSASFGGVIRDILCNEIPVIFRKEIYATACVLGSIVFLILHNFNVNNAVIYVSTTFLIIAIRLVAVKFKLSLPTFYTKE
ncbi:MULTISPECIES: trimeric intracellular cation channel family protein [Flavobacteriaceae]|uniref:Trimeric intracellular cation channel family protein n=2 Tax=Flavobacteriaceae TaxID=49546 RepID=A0A4Y8AWV0_9FLAO|nr:MULTISPECIES: trimeric intracellular cation channel family protein [Flavobacteriaceae]TEW76971.1 trimeric intracellular cation channel family protein [Gramella jeungdoensis]GGK58919.1 membrane protein [Lutibacter litoralis]